MIMLQIALGVNVSGELVFLNPLTITSVVGNEPRRDHPGNTAIRTTAGELFYVQEERDDVVAMIEGKK